MANCQVSAIQVNLPSHLLGEGRFHLTKGLFHHLPVGRVSPGRLKDEVWVGHPLCVAVLEEDLPLIQFFGTA